MNILSMLWKNIWGDARTLRYPARPLIAERFRGQVCFDPALCTGCAQCKFRCTSRAIEFKAGKGEFTWSYDPGQCTFCGRCVEGCKDHALSQQQDTPPIYITRGELKNSYTLTRQKPARPAETATAAASATEPTPTDKPTPTAKPAEGGTQ
jgi:formate hydrogenlyase subunit 6/NADH:ubiquinone oxidoreductase subunit I